MISGQARTRLVQAGAVFSAVALVAGCGSAYRPVVTPINTTGPAAQPQSYAVVVSSPAPTTPGIVTIIDYSGDTVVGPGHLSALAPPPSPWTSLGATGYTINSDGTLTNFPISNNLQSKTVTYTTLATTSHPVNLFTPSSGLCMPPI